MSSQDTERRQYQRIPFIAEVVLEYNNQRWSCNLIDISLKGMLIEPPADVSADLQGDYMIELVLGEDAAIKMQANISHTSDAHWGLKWSNIDLEGLTHLRRLLELNMVDSNELNRELAELG